MTGFSVETISLNSPPPVEPESRLHNWPVVYTLDDGHEIYVGETLSAVKRLRQHRDSETKKHLHAVRVVLHERFNKSAALDLESFLIRLFAGDGKYRLLNRNHGIVDADYYDRAVRRGDFEEIFSTLRDQGLFERSIPEIEQSDLFKLSPFKTLTPEQALAVEDVLRSLGATWDAVPGVTRSIVVEGDPGTGKTIVAVYLMKLLQDLATVTDEEMAEDIDPDGRFAEFFTPSFRANVSTGDVGLVVPQQSLRESIRRVFGQTKQLSPDMVVDPFAVGAGDKHYSVLIVDEVHRLNHRANQPSARQNTRFREINERLFGADAPDLTQLDWIIAKSDTQVLLVDPEQSVRPADLPRSVLDEVISRSGAVGHHHTLASQLRLRAGDGYIPHVRALLQGRATAPVDVGEYEFLMFSNVSAMHRRIKELDAVHGLARLAAGFAWPWSSKEDKSAYDIHLDGCSLRWNSRATDWVNAPESLEEVGSIHTLQGYDLNYAGVIIGPDLRYDEASGEVVFDRSNYFDKRGKQNNPSRGIVYSDEDIREYVINIYRVLMTRGIRGTFVYVCDPALRRYFSRFIPHAESRPAPADLVREETVLAEFPAQHREPRLPKS
ncbi:DNA/RNA helicase domain-containing protein [Nesterenkonia sp. HG001]|uniref:DNA/RNA helicase domain-containing protein n=1 Tax=Nesterenkonia sp. HG001 TaxID=2983207 RepID=UPI002AC63904|nr:DNA/RNA helicase domain-containing protein [Nesterenkonia sp. HG001]MDZ5076102.1 DUF2075 domain-containing protein [Nesterenkonia sp. HG001]